MDNQLVARCVHMHVSGNLVNCKCPGLLSVHLVCCKNVPHNKL